MKLRLLLSLLSAAFAHPFVMNAEPLAVGAPAPELTAVDQDGQKVDLKSVYAKGPTLVYFYPKADTPGCTKQACSIRDDWSALQGKNIQVIGVSGDESEGQKKFQEKYKLPLRF
jgi:peroxiredoxin Q/BCP